MNIKCEVSFCKEMIDKNKQGWDSLRLTGKYLCRYHMRLEMRGEIDKKEEHDKKLQFNI